MTIEHAGPIITAAASVVASVAAALVSLLTRNAVQRVHVDLNSRLTELLKVTKDASYAEGHAAGASGAAARTPPEKSAGDR